MLRLKHLLALSTVAIVGSSLPLAATTLYFQNFDGATPGQSLSAPPLSWTPVIGDIRVGPTSHPGWVGNAVVGNLSPLYTENILSLALPGMPTSGLVTLTFDAWAYDIWSGGAIVLQTDGGAGNIALNPWKNINPGFYNVWTLTADAGFTGGSSIQLVSPENFMRDVTVNAALYIDYDAGQFWGELYDGSTTYIFAKSAFSGAPQITGMYIEIDTRWPWPGQNFGADFDNIAITGSEPIPEPSTSLLLLAGLAGLAGAALRRKH